MAADTISADVKALKLTVASDGIVWTLDGDMVPKSTGLSVAEYLAKQSGEARHLRVPGYSTNAELLLGLYLQRQKGVHSSLEICTPSACAGPAEPASTQLYTSRACRLAKSLGGWHEFTDVDAMSYTLSLYTTRKVTWDDDKVMFLLDQHPGFKALNFVDGMEWRSAAFVIGSILDPRFFTDPSEPDAPPTRLLQYMGIDPKTQSEHPSDTVRGNRYASVLLCWRPGGEPPPADKLTPGQFVWKTYYAKGGGSKGNLAASKRLLDFLRQTWTAAVCTSGQGPRLFLPGYFFEDSTTAEAYSTHATSN